MSEEKIFSSFKNLCDWAKKEGLSKGELEFRCARACVPAIFSLRGLWIKIRLMEQALLSRGICPRCGGQIIVEGSNKRSCKQCRLVFDYLDSIQTADLRHEITILELEGNL